MRYKLAMALIVLFAVSCAAQAEVRTYRQYKDISVQADGDVNKSSDKDDLFEYQYNVDYANKIVTRIKVRRLDESTAKDDSTVYTITEIKKIPGSDAGMGGKIIVAVSRNGGEILELGSKYALTTRTSPFSQIITGQYKRVYMENDHHKWPHR